MRREKIGSSLFRQRKDILQMMQACCLTIDMEVQNVSNQSIMPRCSCHRLMHTDRESEVTAVPHSDTYRNQANRLKLALSLRCNIMDARPA